jgi:hypothetical protein
VAQEERKTNLLKRWEEIKESKKSKKVQFSLSEDEDDE